MCRAGGHMCRAGVQSVICSMPVNGYYLLSPCNVYSVL